MKCITCEYWEATDGDQCEACATTTTLGLLAPTNVAKVVRAWTVPGPVPAHHQRAKERLSVEWPVLYAALEDLCREVGG